MLADGIWAAADVDRAPYAIVPTDADALAAATRELAGPLGAVWSGDARDGFNGGGNYVRWVRDDHDRAEALAWYLPRCDRVRVMPFLDGVPCSIHGLVLPDGDRGPPAGGDLDPARRRRTQVPVRRVVDLLGPACRRPGGHARRGRARRRAPPGGVRLSRRLRHRRRADRRRLPADRAQLPRLGGCDAGDQRRPTALRLPPGRPGARRGPRPRRRRHRGPAPDDGRPAQWAADRPVSRHRDRWRRRLPGVVGGRPLRSAPTTRPEPHSW